jgi:hypothetical protein
MIYHLVENEITIQVTGQFGVFVLFPIGGSGSLKPVGRYHCYYGSTCVPKRWTRI